MSVSPLRRLDREDEREAVAPGLPEPAQRGGARGRAGSLAKLPSAAPEGSPEGSALDHAPSQGEAFLLVVSQRLAVLSGRSPLHLSPPSVAGLWEHHAHAAAQYSGSLWRGLRYAWGAGHCTAAGTAYLLLAVAFSPAGFALAVALAVACWFWL